MAGGIENPILNGPYDAPSRHFELGPNGPTGTVLDGRRPSESFIPVPAPRKGKNKGQQALDLDVAGERRERNDLINEIRYQVGLWRQRGYPGVTPISRKLLQHWADPNRENRVMFCQREAAETAIFLAEVSGRQGTPDFRHRLDAENLLHNDGLPRVALKMSTGTGKTVVMAMLIAWQTINKVYAPRDARYSKRFLVVTPGITIRDRLRVIKPSESDNYYRQRDLVPGDLWGALAEAEIIIANYHAFVPRTAKEMQGVAANTRKILLYGKKVDPFVESPDQIVSRVLRQFGGKGKLSEIVVISDEAHHCYQNKPLDDPDELDSEAEARNVDARVWFKGLQAVAKKVGIKTVYDLSATPYYLSGSGYAEGFIFPWVVSDFSLMDAIESGIVKVPRIPVDDDAASHLVTYLRLWDHVGTKLPKRRGKKAGTDGDWIPPATLEGALRSLYRSYAKRFDEWTAKLEPLGEPPPVMIVVCPNTIVSKLVYDWIAGADIEADDGTARTRPGELDLLSNVVDGQWLARSRTILVDSAQLESGEALKADFKDAAVHEIEAFKAEIRRRDPGADVDSLTDEDLLREVMNTVGKKGKLGEDVRCVVSVSMLTEGWDANTVTHILGIRAFNSQLLCEQVVGRGLRRRDYSVNDEGRFEPEYAEVYGVPFAFIPTDRVPKELPPKRPAVEVRALPERANLRITFPRLTGYRLELPPTPLYASFDDAELHVDKTTFATHTQVDEVFGSENFAGMIFFLKTTGKGGRTIDSSGDYLLWYARDLNGVKTRPVFTPRQESTLQSAYSRVELDDGSIRTLTKQEREGRAVPPGRRFMPSSIYSDSGGPTTSQPFQFEGEVFRPPPGYFWRTNQEGLTRLAAAGLLVKVGRYLRYKMFEDDYPVVRVNNYWDDVRAGGFGESKIYVVQTTTDVVARCLFLATDPGDLVLDPTCGSGTTAHVCEQYGRRWITIDTSRVALTLARQRLMSARYPYYLLADSREGLAKEAELSATPPPFGLPTGDVHRGFVYERVQHVQLRGIVSNPDVREGMSRERVEEAIRRHADFELLYDKPYEDKSKVRVAGPFTVESLSPHRSLAFAGEVPDLPKTELVAEQEAGSASFEAMILENLGRAGIQNGRRNERLTFASVESYAGDYIQAVGETKVDDGVEPQRVGIAVGPQYGTVGPPFIKNAAREALRAEPRLDMLAVLAFSFDPQALGADQEYVSSTEGFADVAAERNLGRLPVLLVRMNNDLVMGDELKKTGSGNLFTVFGEPDIDLWVDGDEVTVEILGVDVYDPSTGDVRSRDTDHIALWMIDTNYNEESFFVRHCYFTGGHDPYERLKRALKADIDEDAWATLYRTVSRPFPKPETGKIAVKVINDYGDEVMQVFEVT